MATATGQQQQQQQQPARPAAAAPNDGDPGPVVGPWQPAPDPNHAPWMPEWTDPAWREDIEYSVRGDQYREHFVSTGGPLVRPAILPRDQGRNPTAFARRFGFYPKDRPTDPDPAVGRSLITPRDGGPSQPQAPAADPFGVEEVWQSVVFGGPTSRELIGAGVYDPNYQFTGTPISGDLHPLFARGRWVDAAVASRAFPQAVCNTRWRFGNEEGQYDVSDDRVWAALEPALRLASRVIASNHPFWNAILSVYHARPVPDDVDGRTVWARQQDGAPLMSLWLDENRPGMYLFASQLKQLGFRSRETTEAILNQYLRFSIGTWTPVSRAHAVTFAVGLHRRPGAPYPPQPRIMIIINPNLLWQMMTPEFPETRAVPTFSLARTILHEMAHAANKPPLKGEDFEAANELLLMEPNFTLQHLPDGMVRNLGITPEMIQRFGPLGRAMYGNQSPEQGQYFFQDGPQCEEGKAFENETWGGIIHAGNPISDENETKLAYMIQCISWPMSHLAPDMQHAEVDRSFYGPYASGGYSGFLLNPPAPVYDQRRPVAVNDYAKFFDEDWWQNVFRRFGHQALKFQATTDSLMILHTRESRLVSLELQRELSAADYAYIANVASPLLQDLNQYILTKWIWYETEDLVMYQATMRRLFYEARTWQRTNGTLNSLADKCTSDIDQLGAALVGWVADSAAGRLQTPASQQTVTAAFNQASNTIMTADLLEFNRLLGYAIQYAQSLIAMYSLLPGEFERRTVHQRYMTPVRDHLNLVRTKLVALLQKVQTFVTYASSINGQLFLDALLQQLVQYINYFVQTANTHGANLERTIGLLADDLVAPGLDYSRHPDALPHIPDARKRLSMRAFWTRASVRPLTYLTASGRSRVLDAVRRWSAILVNHRRERERRRAAGDLGGQGNMFPGLFNSAVAWGASPPATPAGNSSSGNATPQASGSAGSSLRNSAQLFDITYDNTQGI